MRSFPPDMSNEICELAAKSRSIYNYHSASSRRKLSLGKSHLTIINTRIFSNLSGTPHWALTVFLLLAVAVAVPDELAG